MRRRVMMGKRELVEVVEELKSSGTWIWQIRRTFERVQESKSKLQDRFYFYSRIWK